MKLNDDLNSQAGRRKRQAPNRTPKEMALKEKNYEPSH